MRTLQDLQARVKDMALAKGWHNGTMTPDWLVARLALVHAEVSEAVECVRKSRPDEELAEELADVILRVLCVASACRLDMERAVEAKLTKNAGRTWDLPSGLT